MYILIILSWILRSFFFFVFYFFCFFGTEYDARRKFLKSNLTEDERSALAKSRGQSRAAAFGLDGM